MAQLDAMNAKIRHGHCAPATIVAIINMKDWNERLLKWAKSNTAWKGKDEQDSKPLEMPAVNNHGGFGRWAFLEIADPWDAKNTIRAFLRQKESEQ